MSSEKAPPVANQEEAPRIRIGKVGRPTSLDEATGANILKLAELGASPRVICDAVGVARSTLQSWLARGKTGEEPFAEFYARYRQAVAKGEIGLIQCVQEASGRSWQAATWLLERRFRKRWGKPKDALQDDLSKLSDEEVERRLRELESAESPPAGEPERALEMRS